MVLTENKQEKVIKCLQDKCKRYFSTGEYCSIKAAELYGINDLKDQKNVFDKNIIPDANKIDTYKDNIIDLKKNKSVCNLDGNTAYINCALQTNSPWFTLNKNKTACMLPQNFSFPEGITIDGISVKAPEQIDVRRSARLNHYCQEKWYDWFTIPDFHLGNMYIAKKKKQTDINNNPALSKFDVDVCLKPCPLGQVPYNNGDYDNMGYCISRDDFSNGAFKGTSYYTPLAFVNLLGNTQDSLKKYYKGILKNTRKIINDSDYKNLKENLSDFIYNNENICDNIVDEAILQIQQSIHEFYVNSGNFNHTNLLVPDDNLINLINGTTSVYKLEHSYNIAKEFYDALKKKETTNDASDLDTIYTNIVNRCIRPACSGDRNVADSEEVVKSRLLKIFKKACNICFSGENDYSKNYVLYTLNLERGGILNFKFEPFKFDIGTNVADVIETAEEIQEQQASTTRRSCTGSAGSCSLARNPNANDNTLTDESSKFDDAKNNIENKDCPFTKREYPNVIEYIKIFLYLMMLGLIIYLLLILYEIVGPYVTYIINYIFIQISHIWYYSWDLSKDKYTAKEAGVKRAKRSLSSAVRRVNVVRKSLEKP